MMLPKFWARSEFNWSTKLDTSSLYEVRIINVFIGALHSSSNWISPKTHQMTSPMIGPEPNSALESEPSPVRVRHLSGAGHNDLTAPFSHPT